MHLALTLLLRSLQRSRGRLALISGAVAFGVVILLTALSFFNALSNSQAVDWRAAVKNTEYEQFYQDNTLNKPLPDRSESVLIKHSVNDLMRANWQATQVFYVDATKTDPRKAPDLYGITWPQPGQYLVSPGLKKVMDAHPEANIGARFGKEFIGVLPYQMAAGIDEQIALVGKDLSNVPHVPQLVSFDAKDKGSDATVALQVILLFGAVVLLYPVLMLVSVSATLGSVQREERYAALRLCGATNRQITNIILVEALLGAVIGYMAGVLLYYAFFPLFSSINILGIRFWQETLRISPAQFGVVALVTLIIVVGSNAWGMRKVITSPLGVVRRARVYGKPSVLRCVPLIVGVAILVLLALTVRENGGTNGDIYVLIAGASCLMIGLVLASPWLMYLAARISRRFARRAPMIIGSSYVQKHSIKISRSVSGVVLALFAGSLFLTLVSEIGDRPQTPSDTVGTLLQENAVIISDLAQVNHQGQRRSEASLAREVLEREPYVSNLHFPSYRAGAYVYLACADAATYLKDTSMCNKTGSKYLGLHLYGSASERFLTEDSEEAFDRILADKGLVVESRGASDYKAMVLTVERPGDIDRMRTALVQAGLDSSTVSIKIWSGAGVGKDNSIQFLQFMSRLVYLAMAVTLLIAMVSALISTYASLHERRWSLLTLRLSGMRVSELARMMLIESLVPFVLIAGIATGLGYGTGWLMMWMTSHSYGAKVTWELFGGLGIAFILVLAVMLMLLPTLARVSRPANNRRE